MIDPADIYHTGYAVPDLEAAKRFYADALGYSFAPTHLYEPLDLWVPGTGWTEEWLRVTYSREGPHHLELIEGRPGGFYDPARMVNHRHLGMWAEDVGGEVARFQTLGWSLLGAKGSPDQAYGDMAYLFNEASGAVVELVATTSKARITAWFSEPDPA